MAQGYLYCVIILESPAEKIFIEICKPPNKSEMAVSCMKCQQLIGCKIQLEKPLSRTYSQPDFGLQYINNNASSLIVPFWFNYQRPWSTSHFSVTPLPNPFPFDGSPQLLS